MFGHPFYSNDETTDNFGGSFSVIGSHMSLGNSAKSVFMSPVVDLVTRRPSSPSLSDAMTTSAPLHFTEVNKMSLFSLEKRIDYHLSRIMKGHRLINFKNSIERLPTEKRICECILEVLMSSINLIVRKTKTIAEANEMAEFVREMAEATTGQTAPDKFAGPPYKWFDLPEYCGRFGAKLAEVKQLAIGLEQIIWALNSNKEHIKYIVKVFTVPLHYQRSEFALDSSSIVSLRHSISETIGQCEEVITVCRLLRAKLAEVLIKWYIAHC